MSMHSTPRWRIVEGVVTAIERSLNAVPGTQITPNALVAERVSGEQRQIDVLVEIPTGQRTLRVGLEVKDKSSPVDLPEVEQLIAKLSKADLDYGCVVARSGFTASAQREAALQGVELRTLKQIEMPGWWLAQHIEVNQRHVDVLRCTLIFKPDDLAVATGILAGSNSRDVTIVRNDGTTQELLAFVGNHGAGAATNREELLGLPDKALFVLNIQLDGSTIREFRVPAGLLPMPVAVQAQFRLNVAVEQVALTAFADSGGLTAMTGVSEGLERQLIVLVRDAEGGARDISFSLQSLPTKPTVVAPRTGLRDEEST